MSMKRAKSFFATPAVTFLGNHILFNRAVREKLHSPSFVFYYVNMKTKVLGVEICEYNEPDAVEFSPSRELSVRGVKLVNKFFMKDIERLMGWDLRKNCYRVNGVVDDDKFIVSFDLSSATVSPIARLWLQESKKIPA